jgi:hypothetical protein
MCRSMIRPCWAVFRTIPLHVALLIVHNSPEFCSAIVVYDPEGAESHDPGAVQDFLYFTQGYCG